MLIDRDDNYRSNDVITLGSCFNVCLHSRSFLLHADYWKSDSSVNGEPQGNQRWNSNSRGTVANSPFFSRSTSRVPRRLSLLAGQQLLKSVTSSALKTRITLAILLVENTSQLNMLKSHPPLQGGLSRDWAHSAC